MKLLFDENISFRITPKINHLFPDSRHVKDFNLLSIDDTFIWNFSKENGFIIVTFDEDYSDLSLINGTPPKIIWLRTGNISTQKIADLLIFHFKSIEFWATDESYQNTGCFEILTPAL